MPGSENYLQCILQILQTNGDCFRTPLGLSVRDLMQLNLLGPRQQHSKNHIGTATCSGSVKNTGVEGMLKKLLCTSLGISPTLAQRI